MRLRVGFGHDVLELNVPDAGFVPVRRKNVAQPLADVAQHVRTVLESPIDFPPLRRALTPDDHIAIVARSDLGQFVALIQPLLEMLRDTGITLENVTLLFPPGTSTQEEWRSQLPDMLRTVRSEVHDPVDRRKLSYLASTKAGRRIYLNRTLTDADQIVALGRFAFDPIVGYGGGLGSIFPELSDEPTRQEFAAKPTTAIPGPKVWPARQEAEEIGWLLGMPFLLQVIDAEGDGVGAVLGGGAAAVASEGRRLLDDRWRVTVGRKVDLVIAGITPVGSQTIENVARAFAAASRIVQPLGRILVLSHAKGDLGPGAEMLRSAETAAAGLRHAREHKTSDMISVWQLAEAAQHANLSLLSDFPGNIVEELFITPLDGPSQVQRLVDSAESCIYLPDAHRILATIAPQESP